MYEKLQDTPDEIIEAYKLRAYDSGASPEEKEAAKSITDRWESERTEGIQPWMIQTDYRTGVRLTLESVEYLPDVSRDRISKLMEEIVSLAGQ